MKNLDLVFEHVSGNNRYQSFLLCLAFYSNIVSAMNVIASLFTAGIPDFRCFIEGIDDNPDSLNFSENEIMNMFVPMDPKKQTYDTCKWKEYTSLTTCNQSSNYAECLVEKLNESDYRVLDCNHGYIYDRSVYQNTVVTEWDLVCSDEVFITLSTSLFYLGFFIGASFGGLVSDRFGRMKTYRFGSISGLIIGVAISFSPNIIVFSVLRVFHIIFFYQGIIASIVYAVEISKKSWRTTSGMMTNIVFGFGCVFLSIAAYLGNGWRQIQVIVSMSFGISFLLSFYLPPSPRWLCSKQRYDEAKEVFKKMAKGNGVEFDETIWNDLLSNDEKIKSADEVNEKVEDSAILRGLFSRYYTRNLVLCNMVLWMVTSLVYYGLILNSGNIELNLYLSNALGGLLESLACFVSIFISARIGCRRFVVFNLVLSSVTCLASTVIIQLGKNLQGAETAAVVMAMLGRFGASAVFGTLFLQTIELFPTCARTSALGLASMAARIGSIISPWTVQAQRSIPWLSQAIFGTITLVAAAIVQQFPETLNKSLKNTFDESEIFFENYYSKSKIGCLRRGSPETKEKEELE